jgi:hypothetical protein
MRVEASTKRWRRPNWRRGLCGRLDSSTRWKRNCASKRLGRHCGRRCALGKPTRIGSAAPRHGVGAAKTLPQGLLGQAIDYTLKRWEALTRFVDDGVLEIDNNLIENAIRPSALGKKNWLFIGHPEAGERSAVIYTLLGSCRRHGINPFDYLKDLFTRLPAAKITQIKEFTPAAWAKGRNFVRLRVFNQQPSREWEGSWRDVWQN